MEARATRLELFLFTVVLLFISGAPGSFYVKVFNFAPPTPQVVIMLPCLLAMIINIGLRLRATVIGIFVCWAWFLLAIIALASFTWSVSAADTIREAGVMLLTVVYLGMIAGIANWDNILKSMWEACLILMVVTAFLFLAVPKLGVMQEIYPGALVGPWFEKNATGQFFFWAGLINLAYAAVKPKRAITALLMMFVCGGALILTESTTALLAYILVITVFGAVLFLRRNPLISLPVLAIIVFASVPLTLTIMGQSDTILQSLGKSGTLTGRIPVWDAIYDYAFSQRPLLGYGYSAFWVSEFEYTARVHVYDALKYRVPHSHNAYVEARLDLGYVGAVMFLIAFVQTALTTLMRLRSSIGAYFAVPACCAILLVGAVEVSPFSVANWTGFFFVLITAKMTLTPSHADRVSGLWRFIRKAAERAGTFGADEEYGVKPYPVTRSYS